MFPSAVELQVEACWGDRQETLVTGCQYGTCSKNQTDNRPHYKRGKLVDIVAAVGRLNCSFVVRQLGTAYA